MRKLFWPTLAIALLTVFVAQSWYNYECNLMGAQAAVLTVQGVVCWYDIGGMRKFVTLEEMHSQRAKKLRYEECLRAHPDVPFMCEPNWTPPGATPKILNG